MVGGQFRVDTDVSDAFNLYQGFAQIKHKFTDNIELYMGIHSQWLDLNNSFAIEPRFGFNWNIDDKNAINFGYGLHSQTQLRMVYFTQTELNDGSIAYTNKDLDFSKSSQLILGYDHLFNENLRLKFETYYQYLYDIPR